jgi:hypothetical protein
VSRQGRNLRWKDGGTGCALRYQSSAAQQVHASSPRKLLVLFIYICNVLLMFNLLFNST